MTYQSKTDWKYDGIVKETDLNRIEQGIHDAHAELKNVPSDSISLKSGLQTITANRDTPLKITNIEGRTLINLLGRDGNCEDINQWGKYQVTNELDPDNKTNGSYGLKTIVAAGYNAGSSYSTNKNDFQADKHYILIGMLKNGTATDTSLSISGFFTETRSNVVTGSSSFQVAISKFTGLSMVQRPAAVNITGPAGSYSFADEIRLYEITEEEYNAIDTMTPEEIAAKYPYVDCLQNVNAIYVENTGGNLVSSDRSAWKQGTLGVSTGTEAASTYRLRSEFVNVLPNTQYTISVQTGDIGVFQYSDSEFLSNIALTPSKVTFITSAMTTRIRFILRIDNTTIITQDDILMFSPMLTIGSESKPFQPRRKSYMYLPTCQLSANLDGSLADRMYMDSVGKPRVIRQFGRIILDGSIPVTHARNFKEYKSIEIDYPNNIFIFGKKYSTLIKYNGMILHHIYEPSSATFTAADQYFINGKNLRITIANSDSGWGPDYTPTVDEIKAYLLGWKIRNNNGEDYNDPTNTWQKFWFPLGVPQNSDWHNYAVTSVPGEPSISIKTGAVTPYLLQYQLADTVDEPLEYEGGIILYAGNNQIVVGTGIIMGEKANPVLDTGLDGIPKYFINNSTRAPSSMFKNKTSKILGIYRDTTKDNKWSILTHYYSHGHQLAEIIATNYDLSAVYRATYRALDTYKIGIAPSEISAEYASNLGCTVDSLVEENKNALARITVLENNIAVKEQPQEICPSLINGWNINSDIGLSYRKISGTNLVLLRGGIFGGDTSIHKPFFTLLPGFRPKTTHTIIGTTYNDYVNDVTPVTIDILTNGNVRASGTNGTALKKFVNLGDFLFLAEQ
ncbi:Uncharacterised protein [Chlamydia abortus]|nr:Uncharacterised protein [Chlamydia abortus]